jgi:hypothetical protein
MKIIVLNIAMLLAVLWIGSCLAAGTTQKLDDHGRIVMQADDDGSKVVHSYTPNGDRIKSETSRGEQIYPDKKVRIETNSVNAPFTANGKNKGKP